jgi:hypothetical protein
MKPILFNEEMFDENTAKVFERTEKDLNDAKNIIYQIFKILEPKENKNENDNL